MEYAADDTLLKFPEGTYRLNTGPNTHIELDEYDALGLVGENSNVTFKFTSGTDGYKDIDVTNIGNFVYENIDWDITANDCAPGFAVRARDHLHIENLAVRGRQDKNGGFTLQPGIANASGEGYIKNFSATDGCEIGSVERNGVLVASGRNNGTLRFIDCHLEEFSNNGIYAAASGGPIQVEGGTFRNSEPSQLRFSGEGSYVDGATVELDISKMPREYGEQIENARGIWWETKNTTPLRSGGEIRNTDVVMRNAGPPPLEETSPNSSAGILIPSGGVTIRDSTVRMDITPRPAIHAQGPLQSDLPEPYRVVMDNVTVEGSANDWAAVQIEERPGSVIRGCEFDIGYRNGIVLAECDDSTVENTTINSRYGGGRPIVLWGTEASIDNVSTNSDNPLPDGSNGDSIYGPSPVGGGGETEPREDVLTIDSGGSQVEYTVAASEGIEKSTANGASIEDSDTISRSVAVGRTGENDPDSYILSGELVVLDIEGDATVTLGGRRVEPNGYFDNVVTVNGEDSRSEYTLATSGVLNKTGANGATVDNNDTVRGSTAVGEVNDDVDSYKFSGELVVLDVSSGVNVTLNGRQIDPNDYFDNVVTIDGSDSHAEYTLTTSGVLNKTGANGATVDTNDTVSETTASGQVHGGIDSYKFVGEITDYNISGSADVLVNGKPI
ncbi:hypothetical protein C447_01005 [Halococcus hamelinensis 100A6]|uniref:Right handed beta helix domain-containing protein n=2 Tax=Halococcus hamelinensis TaxID=332168 RepID=M0M9S2_9EURY|nr:hypothetical protein C447_01005 [Halococcus hamelinensis 100A6]